MYALRSLGRRSSAGVICVAGVVASCSPRGRMYALRLLGSSAGVICVAGAARYWELSKGSDVRPEVAGSPQLCRCDLRGRRGACCHHQLPPTNRHQPVATKLPPTNCHPPTANCPLLCLAKLSTCGAIRSYNLDPLANWSAMSYLLATCKHR